MLIYDHILQDHEATEENAIAHAQDFDWMETPLTEQDKPRHSQHIDTVNGIDIYYDYGADYYFFADSE